MKKKFVFVFLMLVIAGCSRMEGPLAHQELPAGQKVAETRAALGLLSLMNHSGAPLASLETQAAIPAVGMIGRLLELPSKAVQPKESLEFFQLDTNSSPVLGIIVIGGHVINASGGIPPQNAFMDLVIYENGSITSQIKIPLDQSGIFRFDLVPWNPAYSYEVSTTFNDIEFSSGLIDGNSLQPGTLIEVPILVYDSSINNHFLRALRMKVMYDFSTPGWVHVSETILISNPTSMVIVPAGDTVPVLNYVLPKDAVEITFPDSNSSNRYRLTAGGFGDWQPVLPGDGHQVMVQYSVPFTSSWHCELNSPIPLDSLMVVVKASGIETTSSGLKLNLVQSDPETALAVYVASDLQSEDNYALIFSTRDHIQRVWLGIAFFGLSLTFALLWVIRSRRQRERSEQSAGFAQSFENEDTILDSIIALDDRYKHGDISTEAYRRTRTELVEKLEALRNLK